MSFFAHHISCGETVPLWASRFASTNGLTALGHLFLHYNKQRLPVNPAGNDCGFSFSLLDTRFMGSRSPSHLKHQSMSPVLTMIGVRVHSSNRLVGKYRRYFCPIASAPGFWLNCDCAKDWMITNARHVVRIERLAGEILFTPTSRWIQPAGPWSRRRCRHCAC